VRDLLWIDPQTFPNAQALVRVVDALGRTVWEQPVDGRERVRIDAARWPAGTYVVQVLSGGKTSSRLVVR
jgi:hypothetical protein